MATAGIRTLLPAFRKMAQEAGRDPASLPVTIGGAFPWAARRAVRYGDGWYPNAASGNPEEYLPAFRLANVGLRNR